jgi:ubiquinone/menaquinone biosynthesis C-methylase UbiE
LTDRTLTEKARKDWNQFAEDYQALRGEPGTYNELVEIPAMLSLIGDVKRKKILDAGCGYGYYSILLAKKGATVTGIDISEKMVKLAKENAKKISVKCQFLVCDIQDLSIFASNTFDMAISSIVVGDVDDLGKAFSEVFRVLKRNGVFVFSETHPILKGSWEKDKEGRRLHWNIDNYFERSITTTGWLLQSGNVFETTSRHRTVEDYFDALISSGFVVERLVEPEPANEAQSASQENTRAIQEHYARARRIPIFILFKAKKTA